MKGPGGCKSRIRPMRSTLFQNVPKVGSLSFAGIIQWKGGVMLALGGRVPVPKAEAKVHWKI